LHQLDIDSSLDQRPTAQNLEPADIIFSDSAAKKVSDLIQEEKNDNLTTCTFTTGKSVTYIYNGQVSRIDGASVTIILCLHVLIARRILLIHIRIEIIHGSQNVF
jgi:hypothetical protein